MKIGKLNIVGTPIGNLKDITYRAVEVLSVSDVVYAEDTRVARKLLDHYEIKTPIKSYHEHSKESAYRSVISDLNSGLEVSLISDAGTPLICDPGSRLIKRIREESQGVEIVSVPGPSALTSALSISGLNADSFTFLGFPPHKKGRKTFFENISNIEIRPVVFFESTHRLSKALESLAENLGEDHEVVVAKELTKMHEELYTGSIKEALDYFVGSKIKGEFVVIVP